MLILACLGHQSRAQGKPSLEYQVKAAFLFNFTRFITWPSTAFTADDAPFVIGITGSDPFGNYLDDLVSGERVNGRPIVIRHYAEGADVSGCQLLFIGNADTSKQKNFLSQVQQLPVLTVSDADSFIKAGGMIRFYKDDNHIKMEIKAAAVKGTRLDISSKLLQIAKLAH